ncbi:hypothetical protein BJP36_40335 [Moorena producens JHB]|uniref:Uncharacterized protein n=1 Tax=Moorena producens (strain JHB) TaxID=1454205 RepID=A0A9Q9SS31_MOOP1|nr:hypothetical protein [Moorena producens]WAN68624.1 hypothetical protein BJP36_40335 [Moorena producens JHB]
MVSNKIRRKHSAVSSQQSAVSQAFGRWPRYGNGHATGMATLREWLMADG